MATHSEPLPSSVEKILAYFKRALSLSQVMEIRVTPEEFSVTREIEEGEVFPKGEDPLDVDVDFLLQQVAENNNLFQAPWSQTAYPYHVLTAVMAQLTDDRLTICGMMAHEGSLLADYLGLPEGEAPSHIMGTRVIYHQNKNYADKIVVFGGPTTFLSDATHGIIVETGA